jgi:hypothetical protein
MSNRLAFAGAAFITIAALCRDLCAAEPRYYLLREPVQLVQRLDERGCRAAWLGLFLNRYSQDPGNPTGC